MARFRFRSITANNRHRRGIVEADGPDTVVHLLTTQGETPVEVTPAGRLAVVWDWLNRDLSETRGLARGEVLSLTREWASLLAAGIRLHDVLALSAEGARRPASRRVATRLAEAVRGGTAFADALAAEKGFGGVHVALVRAGEASGSLADAMQRLAGDLDERSRLAGRLRNALIYPAFLSLTAGGAILVLLTVVVPGLKGLGGGDPADLPAITTMVFAVSDLLTRHGTAIALLCAALLILSGAAIASHAGRRQIDRLLVTLPMAGPVIRSLETGRYCATLSALLDGGVPLARALPLAAGALGNRHLRRAIDRAHGRVLDGMLLGDAVAEERDLPADTVVMIRTGERTGRLGLALGQAAALLDTRARGRLEALSVLIGPSLTLIFGGIAGLIVYAMLSTILAVNDLAFQ